jgi:hypothetical protein
MTLVQAQLEFQVRRYQWAKLKAAEEVKEEFPHFWLFKGGLSWKFYQFIKQLSGGELNLFISAFLKGNHRDAVAELGDPITSEENLLLERYYGFRTFSPFEKEWAAQKRRGEKVRFASKRNVQRAMMSNFENAFGHLGLEGLEKADSEGANLRMNFRGWIVQTNFFFGRSQSLIHFDHFVSHPVLISSPGKIQNPFLTFAACWIGMGILEWNYLMTADIEPACDSVIGLCREFFNELPKFLDGLDVENVTID